MVGVGVVMAVVVVVAGTEVGVPGARSTPSEDLGSASSCSAELDLPSTLGGSCSSQEVPWRALSAERRPHAHIPAPPATMWVSLRSAGPPSQGPQGVEGGPPHTSSGRKVSKWEAGRTSQSWL